MEKDILIVDDDKEILRSLREVFLHQGNVVFTAESGSDCLRRIKNGFRGILLIDIMMPKMNGWDTIREIVKNGLEKNVQIVVITAKGTHNRNKMHGLEPYILDYIPKPFDLNKLLSVVENLSY
jgi:DNA-binding response OmpR family regulator